MKNKDGKRDLQMHQRKKGNVFLFGMKAHIGADMESGLVHHIHGTAANVANVTVWLTALFALSSLWVARKQLMDAALGVAIRFGK